MGERGQFVPFLLGVLESLYEVVAPVLTSLNSPQNKNPRSLAPSSNILHHGLRLPGWTARFSESEAENVSKELCHQSPRKKGSILCQLKWGFKIPKDRLKGPLASTKPFHQYGPRRWQSRFLRGSLRSSKEAFRRKGKGPFSPPTTSLTNSLSIRTSFVKALYSINKL